MKLFPIVFLVLYVAEKKFKELFFVFLVVLFSTVIPLLLFQDSYFGNLLYYYENLKLSQGMYAELMIIGGAGNHFGHSLLNGLRVFFGDAIKFDIIAKPYFIFSIFIYLFISFFIIFTHEHDFSFSLFFI